jgi:hypothetical protein
VNHTEVENEYLQSLLGNSAACRWHNIAAHGRRGHLPLPEARDTYDRECSQHGLFDAHERGHKEHSGTGLQARRRLSCSCKMISLKVLLFFLITKIIYLEKVQRQAGVSYLLEPEEKNLFAFLKNRKDKQAGRDYIIQMLYRATG